MKDSELRVGSLYLNQDNEVEKFNMTLIQVDWLDKWKPIPLSEEWLIKFACNKLGPNWWETPNKLQFNFSQENSCGLMCFGSRHVNFWHVHTFQNIVALTGEELTIKETT